MRWPAFFKKRLDGFLTVASVSSPCSSAHMKQTHVAGMGIRVYLPVNVCNNPFL
jgi:hypothetical protein